MEPISALEKSTVLEARRLQRTRHRTEEEIELEKRWRLTELDDYREARARANAAYAQLDSRP